MYDNTYVATLIICLTGLFLILATFVGILFDEGQKKVAASLTFATILFYLFIVPSTYKIIKELQLRRGQLFASRNPSQTEFSVSSNSQM